MNKIRLFSLAVLTGIAVLGLVIPASQNSLHAQSLSSTGSLSGIWVLTKGGTRALADIVLYRHDRDCFASTMTSLDESFSRKWECNAASPNDRLAALKAFHEKGIFTWVSLEPTLDVESSLGIVEATHRLVDLFKVGKANYLGEYSKGIDWQDYTLRMMDLCVRLGVNYYIKRDLQPHLPRGYDNPMRVAQHF